MFKTQTVALRLRRRSVLPDASGLRLPTFVGSVITELAWVSRNTWIDGASDVTAGYVRVHDEEMERNLLRGLPHNGATITRTLSTDPHNDIQLIRYRLMCLCDPLSHAGHLVLASPGPEKVPSVPTFWELPVGENEREEALIEVADMLVRDVVARSRDAIVIDLVTPLLAEYRKAALNERYGCLADVADAAEAAFPDDRILPAR